MTNENLDIILPCFNPKTDWENDVIKGYNSIIKGLSKNTSVNLIIVNDGTSNSLFNTLKIKKLKNNIPLLKIIQNTSNKGKGYALRNGVKVSNSKFIIITDIDFPYETESIIEIYKKLKLGYDVVLGSRDENYYNKVPTIRKIISKTLKSSIKLLLNLPTTDTQCGLKGFNKSAKNIFLSTTINRFLFDLEFVKYCSEISSLKISIQQVNLKEGIVFSKMNYRILIRESFNFIKILIKKNH